MDMVVCEECGGVVHPDFLQLHSDWHDTLGVVKPAVDNASNKLPETFITDC